MNRFCRENYFLQITQEYISFINWNREWGELLICRLRIDIRKKDCILVILNEKNEIDNLNVQEVIINNSTFTYKTSNNLITMPIHRLIKIREKGVKLD